MINDCGGWVGVFVQDKIVVRSLFFVCFCQKSSLCENSLIATVLRLLKTDFYLIEGQSKDAIWSCAFQFFGKYLVIC